MIGMERLEILESRHSIRSFLAEQMPSEIIKKLKAEITMTVTHEQGLRFQLVTDDTEPLKSFSRSYGLFSNPRNYMAAVVDVATPHAYERAGYFAERFVIKALESGLGTCFVGGTFTSSKVKAQVRAGEKILFLVVFGYPANQERPVGSMIARIAHLRKMSVDDFFIPSEDLHRIVNENPELSVGIRAVACAPSAMNKRPVRLFIDDTLGGNKICAKVNDDNPETLIDLGIAKFNYNYATGTYCDWGNGSPLSI